MGWDPKRETTPPPKPSAQVYQEHVRILREIKAPEKLIKIAESVSASAGKK